MHKKFLLSCLAVAFAATAISFAQSPPGIVSGTWQQITHAPSFNGCPVPILLTDGSVMVQDNSNNVATNHWWKYTPDINGSYVNGTWTQLADMRSDYAPIYYASAVLKDGRVVVIGGEYNLGVAAWTNLGAIYDPVANSWMDLSAPPGWTNVGDAECCVLPDGRFMLADSVAFQAATLDPTTLTWTAVSLTGRTSTDFDEEGWTLMPENTVLTADVWDTPAASKYVISNNNWVSAGSVINPMTSGAYGWEMGPAVLRPNGTVFQTGANGHNAVYTPGATSTDPGSWTAGPDFSAGLGADDAPACLLPDGNVLCTADTPLFNGSTHFYEFDGTSLNPVTPPPGAANPSFVFTMLVLPSGQVMLTDFSNDVEIYTSTGAPQDAWRPTIATSPTNVLAGLDYVITGTQFNGLSQANAYGDDNTNASNYPIIRISNNASGHVFYCRTHDHSTMGVATGAAGVSTNFTVPAGIESGPSKLVVVANGIPSVSQDITVGPLNQDPTANAGTDQTVEMTGPTGASVTLDGSGSTDPDHDTLTYTWKEGASQIATGVGPTLTLAKGVHTITLTADDGNGGTDDDTVQITVQDTTKPVFASLPDITVNATSNAGAVVTFGPFHANDTVDGSILGTAAPVSGSTFAPGSTLVTISATDTSSNTGTATFHVKVLYGWSGFLSPLPKTQVKGGSTIPIKFMLPGVTNLAAVGAWALVTGGIIGPEHTIGNFSYKSGSYQLNWKTPTAKGTYRILAHLGDGSVHTIDVIVK